MNTVNEPLYSIATWDADEQAYTPQARLGLPSQNVPWSMMLRVLRRLKEMGYACHRRRDEDGGHDDNDWSVMVERTDGRDLAARL